ncbi:MAG TPA: hypothetical protein VGO09_02315 [Flavisolibacter sp.]|nr:hypothetical protein [Flavisolibacter sp.]
MSIKKTKKELLIQTITLLIEYKKDELLQSLPIWEKKTSNMDWLKGNSANWKEKWMINLL